MWSMPRSYKQSLASSVRDHVKKALERAKLIEAVAREQLMKTQQAVK
jgi:hypothetical protein